MQMSSSVFANKDRAHLERNRVLSTCSTCVPASVSEMFEDPAWPCARSTPHVCHPSESSGSTLQVVAHTAVRLRGKLVCSRPQKLLVPDHVCRDTLPGASGCPELLQLLQNRVHPATSHDVCSRKQVVLVHLFEDFHALQEIELSLTSLLLGNHCHVFVSLKETLRRRPRRAHVGSGSCHGERERKKKEGE